MGALPRNGLVHGLIVRDEPVLGVYVVERPQFEQSITDMMKKLETYGLSVYTIVESIPLKAGKESKLVATLIMHIRHGTASQLRAPLHLSFEQGKRPTL